MANRDPDLLFSVGASEQDLDAVEKRLEKAVAVWQKVLGIKNEPLTPTLKSIGTEAQKSVKPLTDLEKAARSLSAAQKVVSAEQKAGLITQEQAISKLKSLSTEYGKTVKSADSAEKGYGELTQALGNTVTATSRLEAAQVKAQKAFRDDQVRQYRDAQNNLRTEVERGAISLDRYRVEANDLQEEMVQLRDTLPRTSSEFGALDRVIGQTARGITTAEGNVSKLGLSQQVALGSTNRLTTGVKTLGGGFVGLGGTMGGLIGVAGFGGMVTAIGNMDAAYQDATKTIRTGTGATGAELEGLVDSFEAVGSAADDDLGLVASTMTELSKRTGATGDDLEALTGTMLDLADVTGEDVNGLVQEATRLFGDWGVATENQAGTLDYLFKVSQQTGISVGKLSENLVKYGAPLRQLGFDFETSAALMGKFEQEGVNTELVLGSLRIALGKMSKEGVADTNEALTQLVDRIQSAGSAGEANALAIETFGARAGPDMAAAIREGRFEVDELLTSLEASGETIAAAAEEGQTFNERMAEFRNSVTLAAEPLAGELLGGLEGALGLFESLPGPAQQTALGVGGITTAVGVLVPTLGVLKTASLGLFAPPAGALFAGIAIAGALGVGLVTLTSRLEDAATGASALKDSQEAVTESGTRYLEHLSNAETAVSELQAATGEEGLTKALKTYASTLNTEGQIALNSFMTKTLSGVLAQGKYQEAVDLSIAKIIEFERAARKNETEQNNSLMNQNSEAIKVIQRTVDEAEARLKFYQDNIGTWKDRFPLINYEEWARKEQEAIAESLGNMDQLLEQNELLRRENVQLEISTTRLTELQEGFASGAANAQQTLAGLLTELGYSEEEVRALTGATEEATTATDANTTSTGTNTTALNNQTDATETTKERTRELTTAYENLSPALRDVVNAQLEYQALRLAAGGDNVIPDVSAALDTFNQYRALLTGLITDLRAQRDEVGLTGEAFLENARNAETAATSQEVWGASVTGTREGLSGMRQSVIDAAEAQRLLTLETLEGADTGGDYVRSLIANSEAQAESFENSESLRESFDLMAGGTRLLGSEMEDLATVTAAVELPQPEVSPEFEDYIAAFDKALPDALSRSAGEAALFGENFNGVAAEADLLRAEIESLLENGMKPNDAVVQELSERYLELQDRLEETAEANENYAENLEDTRNAQKALADASGIATEDINDLIASLDVAAQGTGRLGAEARQAQADLAALMDARGLAFVFQEIGETATLTLEAIPNLSTEAQVGLGALAGAGNATFEALQDGAVDTGEIFGILEGAVSGIADALGEDLPAEARIGFDAVEGALGGAAAGAVFGPWGAVIGGVLGGIQGLFSGIVEEQERVREEQEAITAEAKRSHDEYVALQDTIRETGQDTGTNLLQERLDFAVDSGEITEDAARIQQARIDMLDAVDDYQDALAGLDQQQNDLNDALAAGTITQAEYNEQSAELTRQRGQLFETLGYQTAGFIDDAEQAAKDLGLSQEELYTALLTGNEEVLGQLDPQQREALRIALGSYYSVFGELPPEMAAVAEELGYGYDAVTGTFTSGGQQISAAGHSSGQVAAQGVSSGVGLISSGVLSSFGSLLTTLDTQTDTMLTTQGGTATSLSGGFADIFTSAAGAITTAYPGTEAALGTAYRGIYDVTGAESVNLKDQLFLHERELAERQKRLFLEQEIMAGKYGPLAKAQLEDQLEAERKALYDAVSGGGGLLSTLGISETSVTGALASFFGSQRTTLETQGGSTVRKINTEAADIREAMAKLIAAAAPPKSLGSSVNRIFGGGGGGGGSSGPAGMFAPLNSFVDERALGGMSSEFGSLDTWSIMRDTEEGSSFGYGTSFSQPVRPVGGSYGGGRSAGALAGLLKTVRDGVEVYKLGVVSSINAARATQRKGFNVLGYDFRKGIIEEAKRNAAVVKGTKKDYDQMRQDFLSSFDLLSGSALLKRIGGVKSPLYDIAKQIGTDVESGFKNGLSGGLQGFIFGSGGLQESLQRMTFDMTVNGLIQSVMQSGLLEKLFGGVYGKLTAQLVEGDITGAMAAMQEVLAKVPSVSAQLEQLFAPLKGAAQSLGYHETPDTSTRTGGGGISLESRQIGSASPEWVNTMSRVADLNFKAANINMEAVKRFERLSIREQNRSHSAINERGKKGTSNF